VSAKSRVFQHHDRSRLMKASNRNRHPTGKPLAWGSRFPYVLPVHPALPSSARQDCPRMPIT
jgi:hypothetical protein